MNDEQSNTRPGSGRVFMKKQTFTLPDFKAHLVFWSCLAAGLALDLWTKKAVFDWLPSEPGHEYPIIDGFVKFVMYRNNGAAFGILSGQRYMLIAFSIFALVAIVTIFLFSRVKHKLVPLALGLCTVGVFGNLYDRIFNDGYVRDFIDVVYRPGRHWPAFNIADSALCIGVGLMIIATILTEQSARKHAQQQK